MEKNIVIIGIITMLITSYIPTIICSVNISFDHGEEVGTFKAWYGPHNMVKVDTAGNNCYYEYTFGHNGHYSYKQWSADGTIIHDYCGDKTVIPNRLKRLTFKPEYPYIMFSGYCFRY